MWLSRNLAGVAAWSDYILTRHGHSPHSLLAHSPHFALSLSFHRPSLCPLSLFVTDSGFNTPSPFSSLLESDLEDEVEYEKGEEEAGKVAEGQEGHRH